MDVTLTHTTYLSIVANHVHLFMEKIFPDSCGLVQQDNAPKMLQEWFEERNNEFEVLTWPSNSLDLNSWDVLDKEV